MKQLHLVVFGQVQGVGFRYYAQTMALAQQIKGWVRNLSDGSVEIVAEGDTDYIESYLSSVKTGSPFSTVESVIVTERPSVSNFTSFTIKY